LTAQPGGQKWRVREPVAANGNAIGEGVGLIDQFLPFAGRLVLDPIMFLQPGAKAPPRHWRSDPDR
jgi:hypothetical protein